MYGLVFLAVKEWVLQRATLSEWAIIAVRSCNPEEFITKRSYDDAAFFKLIRACSEVLKMKPEEVFEEVGGRFYSFLITKEEHEQQLRLYKGNEADVFVSCFKAFCSLILGVAPNLEVVGKKTIYCHVNYIPTAGWPSGASIFFLSILRSLAGELCQVKDFQYSRIQSNNKEDIEEFVLNWTPLAPYDEDSGSRIGLTGRYLSRLHPFHIIFDRECNVVQSGPSLIKLIKAEPGNPMEKYFTIKSPAECDFANFRTLFNNRRDSIFTISIRSGHNLLDIPITLTGQMIYLTPKAIMIFVCSPQVNSLDDVRAMGLRISDFSLLEVSKLPFQTRYTPEDAPTSPHKSEGSESMEKDKIKEKEKEVTKDDPLTPEEKNSRRKKERVATLLSISNSDTPTRIDKERKGIFKAIFQGSKDSKDKDEKDGEKEHVERSMPPEREKSERRLRTKKTKSKALQDEEVGPKRRLTKSGSLPDVLTSYEEPVHPEAGSSIELDLAHNASAQPLPKKATKGSRKSGGEIRTNYFSFLSSPSLPTSGLANVSSTNHSRSDSTTPAVNNVSASSTPSGTSSTSLSPKGQPPALSFASSVPAPAPTPVPAPAPQSMPALQQAPLPVPKQLLTRRSRLSFDDSHVSLKAEKKRKEAEQKDKKGKSQNLPGNLKLSLLARTGLQSGPSTPSASAQIPPPLASDSLIPIATQSNYQTCFQQNRLLHAFIELLLEDSWDCKFVVTKAILHVAIREPEPVKTPLFEAVSVFFNSMGKFPQLLQSLFEEELLNSPQLADSEAKVVLREESVGVRLFVTYLKLEASYYLQHCTSTLFKAVEGLDKPLELNPAKVPESECAENAVKLLEICQNFLVHVCQSADYCPPSVRRAFHVISEEVARYLPTMYLRSIANLLFLRFLSPAIVSPPPGKTRTVAEQRTLTLVSKSVYSLMNNIPFGEKEPFMAAMNAFISESNVGIVQQFMRDLVDEEKLARSIGLRARTAGRAINDAATLQFKSLTSLNNIKKAMLQYMPQLWASSCTNLDLQKKLQRLLSVCLCDIVTEMAPS